jgi:hypothetical protein
MELCCRPHHLLQHLLLWCGRRHQAMELGLLNCQLRVTFTTFSSDHIGCKLRRKVRELVAAKPIVEADVEGKDIGLAEALVMATAVGWRALWLDDGDSSATRMIPPAKRFSQNL